MEVNRKKRGRPSKNNLKLEKSVIIQTARQLTLKESKVPSIRRLASKLDVDPMAIYYYFSNKQKLLEAVSISLIQELYIPVPCNHWKENLMNLSRSYLSLLLTYPDLIGIILAGPNESAAAIFIDRFNASIAELELNHKTLKNITDLVADYLHGFAYASACNKTEIELSDKMAEGPLNFIFDNIK